MRERNFVYAVGYIRALETKLLDDAQLERISDAANLSDALTKLGETEYGVTLAGLKHPKQFESALNQELSRVGRLLINLSENAPEFQVFLHRYDIQNLKAILKNDTVPPVDLSILGVWTPEWLIERIRAEELTALPQSIREAIEQAQAAYKTSGDSQEIDRILDKAWFSYGYQVLKAGISPLLFNWWEALIDLTNLRIFIRLRLIGMVFQDFIRFFIPDGLLSADSFKELWDQPDEKVALYLANTPYDKILNGGVRPLSALSEFERRFDNYLIERIQPAKMISFGIEPLVGYWLAKENEVKILRIILVGKVNQMANVEIKERLRHAYA
jgi:V/A-type H+-transporting ATPase subunit C